MAHEKVARTFVSMSLTVLLTIQELQVLYCICKVIWLFLKNVSCHFKGCAENGFQQQQGKAMRC
jgi:hypothetical protein